MFEIVATAIRIDEAIQVTLHGFLLSSSWGASVTGTYPGSIVHVTDPGYAEVYLQEYEIPGSLVSLRSPMPWSTTVNVIDPRHSEVVIFVNNQEAWHIAVSPMPLHFDVYALIGSEHWGSVIVPAGHTMGKLFHHVFGPASHKECVRWINEHARPVFDIS